MPPILSPVATLAALAWVVALVVAAIVASRRQAGQHRRSEDALWHELRRAHGLSRREVRLLRRAAESASLDPTTLIFVEPHVFKRLLDENTDDREARRALASKLYS